MPLCHRLDGLCWTIFRQITRRSQFSSHSAAAVKLSKSIQVEYPNSRTASLAANSDSSVLEPSSFFFLQNNAFVRREGGAIWRILKKSNLTDHASLRKMFGIDRLDLFTRTSSQQQQRYPRGAGPGPNQQQGHEDSGNDPNKPDGPDKMPMLPRLFFLGWLMFAIYTTLRLLAGEDSSAYRMVSWNEFVHDMLTKGEVDEIIVRPEAEIAIIQLVDGAILKGKRAETNVYTMKLPDAIKFEEKVRQIEKEIGVNPGYGVPITYQRESSWVPVVVMGVLGLLAFMLFKNFGKINFPNPTDMFASERKAKFVRVDQMTAQGKSMSFKDVAGLKEAKTEIMEFVGYLKHPQKFKNIGARVPRGALLLGPPGCGKTLLAKALANEAHVPFLAMAGSEFVEVIGGLGAARVRDLFKEARKQAPCIIYIDEIDAIGRRRGSSNASGSGEEEHTLNQLLVEMDGMDTVEGVIMLASTNRSDVLDKALLRPGRFDRHISIDLPTMIERREIFDMYLQKLKLEGSPSLYSPRLSQLTPGMSGADIANICNEAALSAARTNKNSISAEDFDYAVERVVAGSAKKTRILSPTEKRRVAYHEAGHAVTGWLLKYTDALLKVSIIPRTSAALGFAQYLPSDQKLHHKDELFERMCMMLGGRVAESLKFNTISTGAQDDLQKVTRMAYAQIKQFGMNDVIGHVAFDEGDEKGFAVKPYSRRLAYLIDEESRMLVARAYKETERLLKENSNLLEKLAETLLEKESLSYEAVANLIGPPPHGAKKQLEVYSWETWKEPVANQKNRDS